MKFWSAVLLSVLLAGNTRGDEKLLGRASDLAAALRETASVTADLFDLTATVSFTRQEDDHILFAIEDATGHADINLYGETIPLPEPGMRLRITGRFIRQVPFRESL